MTFFFQELNPLFFLKFELLVLITATKMCEPHKMILPTNKMMRDLNDNGKQVGSRCKISKRSLKLSKNENVM
jgi:hypothetical protein